MALTDGVARRVAEGGFSEPEEPQRVANKSAVLGIRKYVDVHRARCGGQPELDSVKVPEHAAPLPVDRAVAFIRDNKIKVAWRKIPLLRDHGLQGRDGDQLGPVESPAGPQHVTRVVPEMIGGGVFGLSGQRDAVHEQQPASPSKASILTRENASVVPLMHAAARGSRR